MTPRHPAPRTPPTKEKRFLDALESLFTGAAVDGASGYINLMRIKRRYFESIRPQLMEEIDKRADKNSPFREELFDKLYTFFNRYFCESGSIYFRHLPAFSRIYDRVYVDGRDVALTWKTRMLYYVKSDTIICSMPVELREPGTSHESIRLYFDASELEHQNVNARRDFIFSFDGVRGTPAERVIHLKVGYSRHGSRTNITDILRRSIKGGIALSENHVRKAVSVFRRQTEVDFFINKNAREFLHEQLNLWIYQYIFKEESVFEEHRIRQIQAIKETGVQIIDFIAQFEDELCRVWEKPRFVRNVNYVVTIDKLQPSLLRRIAKHKNARSQVAEWCDLGVVSRNFKMADILPGQKGTDVTPDYRFLPLDTRHFKDIELDVLGNLGNLDEVLDGELIYSENWQALNTLHRRLAGRIKCIHIDPPYNTKSSGFLYRNDYRHSSWLTMMDNRVSIGVSLLSSNGSFLCHIDENEYEKLHLLLDSTNLLDAGTVVWNKMNPMMGARGIATQHEYVLWRTRHKKAFYLKDANAALVLAKSEEIVKTHGRVNDAARREFAAWVSRSDELTTGKAYRCLEDDGRVYQSAAMGAPQKRLDEKFHVPIIHPGTKQPCPIPTNGWSRTPENIQRLLEDGEIIFGADHTVQPRRKIFLNREKHHALSTVVGNGKRGQTDIRNLGLEFPYCHPVSLYETLIAAATPGSDGLVLDYFGGSGTTAHAVINLNRVDQGHRKYILLEMGEHFYSVLLPRIKKIIFSGDWKRGKPMTTSGSSHFLKYYTLEQYEETLKNAHYEDCDQLTLNSTKSPFEQYVFFADDKLAHAIKPEDNAAGDHLEIRLHDLYHDIDIAESLSNILGKPIYRRTSDHVQFGDGSVEKTNPETMTVDERRRFVSLIKPYLWWGQ